MTEVPQISQQQKIQKKIEELKKRKAELEKKLKDEQAFNRAAWEQYGSELCVSELERNEQAIKNEIKSVYEDIALLQEWQWATIIHDDIGSLEEILLRISEEEKKALKKRKGFEGRLAK